MNYLESYCDEINNDSLSWIYEFYFYIHLILDISHYIQEHYMCWIKLRVVFEKCQNMTDHRPFSYVYWFLLGESTRFCAVTQNGTD